VAKTMKEQERIKNLVNSWEVKVIEIPTEMKEVIWIGVRSKPSPYIEVCISFIY
jgi:hypothetical protein